MRSVGWYVRGLVGLTLLTLAAAQGCAGEDPEGELEEGGMSEDPTIGEVGEVEQAVGVGGCCGGFFCGTCDAGLTCCGPIGDRRCRNLQTDNSNCGSCGNVCGFFTFCDTGHCCVGGTQWCPLHQACTTTCVL